MKFATLLQIAVLAGLAVVGSLNLTERDQNQSVATDL